MMMRLLMGVVCLWMPVQALAQEEARRIVVSGLGSVEAAPDMAEIQFGVAAEATQAQVAMDDVSADVRAVFQVLLDYGIAPRDLQTTALRLDPIWENRRSDRQGPPEVRGFVATNDIRLRLRDMTSLGAVLQSVLDAGINRVSSISFTLSEPDALRDAARREAVAQARAKATLLAQEAGVTLGRVMKITEGTHATPQPMMRAQAMAMDSGVPLAGGALDITAQVNVTFEIVD